MLADEVITSSDRAPCGSRNGTTDHSNTRLIVAINDGRLGLRMAKDSQKRTQPKCFGHSIGESAELGDSCRSAHERAEPGTVQDGSAVQQQHVGDGRLATRMIVNVGSIGVPDEYIRLRRCPLVTKAELRGTSEVLNDGVSSAPRRLTPLAEVAGEVVGSTSDVGTSLGQPQNPANQLAVRQVLVVTEVFVGDNVGGKIRAWRERNRMSMLGVTGNVSRSKVDEFTDVLVLSESNVTGVRVGMNGYAEDLGDARRIGDGVTLAECGNEVGNQVLAILVNKDREIINVGSQSHVHRPIW